MYLFQDKGEKLRLGNIAGYMTRFVTIISCIASKPIYIRWIRTGSQPYGKIMSSIVLYKVFFEYKKIQS